MNKTHEEIKRSLFDAEKYAAGLSDENADTRDCCIAKVNRMREASQNGLGVELIASRKGWECFTNYLLDKGIVVETRRWIDFGPNINRYDLYVEKE